VNLTASNAAPFRQLFGEEIGRNAAEERNLTSYGCLAMSSSGLLHTAYEDDCQAHRSPVCEYRGEGPKNVAQNPIKPNFSSSDCRTERGKTCIFPFTYRNVSVDGTVTDLNYTSCTSLDLYVPWCPTKVNASTGDILEWDFCLEDCPSEPPEVVCQDVPVFPSLVGDREDSLNVNYTTLYDPEVTDVVRELDYVSFECPVGYVFTDTLNVTVYALCHNWEWMYENYDEDSQCVRK